MGHVGRNYILFLCMELRKIARFRGLDKKFNSSRFCDVPAVSAVLFGYVAEILREAGAVARVHGVLRLRSASPHSAQDDKIIYWLGGVSVTV